MDKRASCMVLYSRRTRRPRSLIIYSSRSQSQCCRLPPPLLPHARHSHLGRVRTVAFVLVGMFLFFFHLSCGGSRYYNIMYVRSPHANRWRYTITIFMRIVKLCLNLDPNESERYHVSYSFTVLAGQFQRLQYCFGSE